MSMTDKNIKFNVRTKAVIVVEMDVTITKEDSFEQAKDLGLSASESCLKDHLERINSKEWPFPKFKIKTVEVEEVTGGWKPSEDETEDSKA